MTPRTAIALLALTGLTVAACGSDDSDTSSRSGDGGATPTEQDLSGKRFVSTEVTGGEIVEDSEITMSFDDGSVSVNAGCNTMNGGFEIADGTLVTAQFASTMMACDEPLMEQDGWLSDFLSASPTIALDGSTLTLGGDGTTITLEEIESAPLIGTTWLVTGTVATQAVSSVPVGSTASITIADNGTVAVDTGCNGGSGSVEVTDTTLTFGPIATTRRACVDELNALEASVLNVLQGDVTYEIEDDSLSLRSSEGDIGLELTAQR